MSKADYYRDRHRQLKYRRKAAKKLFIKDFLQTLLLFLGIGFWIAFFIIIVPVLEKN